MLSSAARLRDDRQDEGRLPVMSTAPDHNLVQAFLTLDPDLTAEEGRGFLAKVGAKEANRAAWAIGGRPRAFSTEQIVHLVKVFTRLENATIEPGSFAGRFCGGSTTAVPHLLSALRDRSPELAADATEWALRTALNPYNPFGTYNGSRLVAGSVAEYRALEGTRFARIRRDNEERSAQAKERAALRARRHASRLLAHQASNAQRAVLLESLAALPANDRMRRVARESSMPIGAIPDSLVNVEAALALPAADQALLLQRLQRAPRGPWQRVRLAIEKSDRQLAADLEPPA
jgi:hypothetical protein